VCVCLNCFVGELRTLVAPLNCSTPQHRIAPIAARSRGAISCRGGGGGISSLCFASRSIVVVVSTVFSEAARMSFAIAICVGPEKKRGGGDVWLLSW